MVHTLLKDVEVGSLVKLSENGNPVEFYVACHDYESNLNGTGRTLLVRKDVHSEIAWDSDNVNEYAASDIDAWLNGDYAATLDEAIRNNLGETNFYYTYKVTNNVATLSRSVFLLSLKELNLTNSNAKVEGTALPIASDLKIAYENMVTAAQWTRTSHNSNTTSVFYIQKTGSLTTASANTATTVYVRPAFTLPNDSAYVIDDGTIRFDPVTISGRDEYLGKKANTFHVEYSVTSLSGSGATITETLNGEVIRTYTAVDGELQTATLNAANLDERDHTFTITATSNSTNEPTERRYIFYAVPLAIHDGGTIQEFQDENSEPIFPATMASAVIAKNGKSVERLLSDLVDPNTYVWGVYQPPGQPYKIDSEVVTIAISRIVDYQNGSGTIGINYADGIECSDTVISLVNPTTWSGGMSHSNADILAETLKGKFWTHNGGIYYIPTAVEGVVTYSTGVVTAGYTSAKTSHTFKIKCQAVSISMITDMLFLGVTFSQNIDAYPENGAQDYWHYVLFGNLIESIVNSTPRLEMGQYTGTGTTGAANPCIITFKHKPRIVWICARTAVSGGYNGGQPWIYGSSAAFSGIYANGGSSSYAANLTWTGNTLKWYSNGADQQLNTSGVIYDYFSLY